MAKSKLLSQIVFACPAAGGKDDWAREAKSLWARTSGPCAAQGIGGAAMIVNGHHVGVIEGSPAHVEALFAGIRQADPQRGWSVVAKTRAQARLFDGWAVASCAHTEPGSATTQRLADLARWVAGERAIRATEFLRRLCMPHSAARPMPERGRVPQLALAGPNRLWPTAMLPHIADKASTRIGRTQIEHAADPACKSVIDYVDVELPAFGPVRVVSPSAAPAACAPQAALLDDLALVAILTSGSDAEIDALPGCVQQWRPAPGAPAPRFRLVTTRLSARLAECVARIESDQGVSLNPVQCRLGDAAATWQVLRADLLAAVKALPAAPDEEREPMSDWLPMPDAAPRAAPRPAPSALPDAPLMQALADAGCLEVLLGIDGCEQALVVEARSTPPRALLFANASGDETEPAPAGLAWLEIVCGLMRKLSPDDPMEDLLATTTSSVQVFRPLRTFGAVYLGVRLAHRASVQPAMARRVLGEMAHAVDLAIGQAQSSDKGALKT